MTLAKCSLRGGAHSKQKVRGTKLVRSLHELPPAALVSPSSLANLKILSRVRSVPLSL